MTASFPEPSTVAFRSQARTPRPGHRCIWDHGVGVAGSAFWYTRT